MNKKSELEIRLAIYKTQKRINELTQKDRCSQEKIAELKRSINRYVELKHSINGYNLILTPKKIKLNQLIMQGLRIEILLLKDRIKRFKKFLHGFNLNGNDMWILFLGDLSRKLKYTQLVLRYFRAVDKSAKLKKVFDNDIDQFLITYYEVNDPSRAINVLTIFNIYEIKSKEDYDEAAENFKKNIEIATNLYKEYVLTGKKSLAQFITEIL